MQGCLGCKACATSCPVKVNIPYSGGFITRNYGNKNTGFHSIQIEVNKSLYMNEENYKVNENVKNLQIIFQKLFDQFMIFTKLAAE